VLQSLPHLGVGSWYIIFFRLPLCVVQAFVPLSCYATSFGSRLQKVRGSKSVPSSRTARPLTMGPISCPKKSVNC